MVIKSLLPDLQIPEVDLWGYMFERGDKRFPDNKGKKRKKRDIQNKVSGR